MALLAEGMGTVADGCDPWIVGADWSMGACCAVEGDSFACRTAPMTAPARVPTTPITAAQILHHRFALATCSSSLNCSCNWCIAKRRAHSFWARMCLLASGFQPFCQCARSTSDSPSSSSHSDLSSVIRASVLVERWSRAGATNVCAFEPSESGVIQRACAVHNLCSARSNV